MKRITIYLIALLAMYSCSKNEADLVLEPSSIQLKVGETKKIQVLNNNTDINWSVVKDYFATVDDYGVVTGRKVGKTIAIAQSGDKKSTCKIEIIPRYDTYIEPVTEFGITMSELIEKVGPPVKITTNSVGTTYHYNQNISGSIKARYLFVSGLLKESLIIIPWNNESREEVFNFIGERYILMNAYPDSNLYYYMNAETILVSTYCLELRFENTLDGSVYSNIQVTYYRPNI